MRRDDQKVLLLKSSHHRLVDKEGSDSWRLTGAGASGVVLLAPDGLRMTLDPPPGLEELLAFFAPRFDWALIEGGKSSSLPKVELLAGDDPLLPADQVVGRLSRGRDPRDPRPVTTLLDWLDSKGHFFEAPKL